MATLLLADDSVTIQRVIELTFADEGVRVIAVGDGESAIARIDAERPDIVLADVGMPGVDGYQVAMHVKRSPELAHVPVLLLTGAFEPIDEERARETGCDGVLVKPFEPRQLIKTVRGLLAGERPAALWPEDMPRAEARSSRPVVAATALPSADEPHPLSVPYEADSDQDLAAALARLEFVAVQQTPLAPVPADPQAAGIPAAPAPPAVPSSREWDLSAAPAAARSEPAAANMSLATVFSALLSAERQHPESRASMARSPSLSEAAVEEVVQKVVRRMTDELVRKIVLETAERLIREEIDRIKA